MLKNFLLKLTSVKELLKFFWKRKLWWLIPIIIFLVLIGFILIVAQTSSLGPFIYTLF